MPKNLDFLARTSVLCLLAAFLLSGLVPAQPALACFGPKLYIGTGDSAEERVLYEVVSLYLKEKTGVESVRVELGDKDAAGELHGERVDLALARGSATDLETLLAIENHLVLLSGRRPLEDLQFTTVAPALRKLDRLLQPEHLAGLTRRVADGQPPAAEARHFLMGQGWI